MSDGRRTVEWIGRPSEWPERWVAKRPYLIEVKRTRGSKWVRYWRTPSLLGARQITSHWLQNEWIYDARIIEPQP